MPQVLLENPVETHSSLVTSTTPFLVIDCKLKPGEKYFSYEEHKRIIAGKFPSVQAYMRYVKENELYLDGLSDNPYAHFKKEYLGCEDFLGVPLDGDENFRRWVVSHRPWEKAHTKLREKGENTRMRKLAEKVAKKSAPQPKTVKVKSIAQTLVDTKAKSDSQELSIKNICKFLLSKNMGDIAESIARHKQLALSDAREIALFLLDHYRESSSK